jgi:hypothetical protein
MISADPECSRVIRPYLGGEAVNRLVELVPINFAINFGEMSEADARRFPLPWEHIEREVRPERLKKDAKAYPRQVFEWWKYWHSRQALYERIQGMDRVIVCARVSKRLMLRFAPANWTFNDKVIVIARESFGEFVVLQSNLHEAWAWKYGSTLKADLNYVAKSCHGTFPFPSDISRLHSLGEAYDSLRQQVMVANQEGLTASYNRLHVPGREIAHR